MRYESSYHIELKESFKKYLKERFQKFGIDYIFLEEKRVGEIIPDFYLKFLSSEWPSLERPSLEWGRENFPVRAIVECLTPFSIAMSPRIFQKKVRDYKSFCDEVWFVVPNNFPVTWDEIQLREEAKFLRLAVSKNPTFAAHIRWYKLEGLEAGTVIDTPRVFPRVSLKMPKRYAYIKDYHGGFDYTDTLFEDQVVGGYGIGDMPNVQDGYYAEGSGIHRWEFEPFGSGRNCVEFWGDSFPYSFETYWSYENGRMDFTGEKEGGKWTYKELENLLTNIFLEFLSIMGYTNQKVRITRSDK